MYLSGIYQIRNTINDNRYIGSSSNLMKRRDKHFSKLKLNKHDNIHLQNAFNRYGKENFIFEILLNCSNEYLEIFEQELIDDLKPEYNIRELANSNVGVKRSEDYKKMVGDFFRGKHISDEHKKNIAIANRLKPTRNNTGFKGVAKCNSKFKAYININGKRTHLGCFDSPEEAHNAYINATNSVLGEGGYTDLH